MKISVAFLAVFCLSAASAVTFRSGRIAGGTQAALGDFPYFASVYYNNGHVCGGFIHNIRWVITAASCVAGRDAGLFTVHVGQVNLIDTAEPTEQTDVVRQIFSHPNYDAATGANDIAILQLRNDLIFNNVVYYVPYDVVNPDIPDAAFMGFGNVINTPQAFSRLLNTTLTLNQDCSAYPGFSVDTMICAGSASSSPCPYDEGGPLVQVGPNGPVAKGILSKQSCASGTPATFTRLSVYYDFINSIAGPPYVPTPAPPTTTVPPVTTVVETTVLPTDTVPPAVARRHLRH